MRLFLFLLLLVLGARPAEAKQDLKTLREDMKHWVFTATTNALTFSHDTYEERLTANAEYFTLQGCQTFMTTMRDYAIYDRVIERKETLVTNRFWEKHVRLNIYDQIVSEEEHKDRDGLYDWKISVPLLLNFSRGTNNRDYRFVAVLRVIQSTAEPPVFKIDKWYISTRHGGMAPTQYNPKRLKKDYSYCYHLYK